VENTITSSPFENMGPQTLASMFAETSSASEEFTSKLEVSVKDEDAKLRSPTLPDKVSPVEAEKKETETSPVSETAMGLKD